MYDNDQGIPWDSLGIYKVTASHSLSYAQRSPAKRNSGQSKGFVCSISHVLWLVTYYIEEKPNKESYIVLRDKRDKNQSIKANYLEDYCV